MGRREPNIKPRRQVVLVIVEGQSDENVLTVPLTEALEEKYGSDVIVHFAKMHNDNKADGGDITSIFGATPEKMKLLVNKLIIMPCLDIHSLMPKHVCEIIHIIDVDGVYIKDDRIIQHTSFANGIRVKYVEDAILAINPHEIVDRNSRKRKNIDALLDFQITGFEIQRFCDTELGNKPTTKATCVPYSLYFFSCNLDHFICRNANLDRYNKIAKADEFARNHGNDLISFMEYLNSDSAAINDMTHSESWNFIKQDNNSLNRFTNIGLLIKSLCDPLQYN